MSSRPDPDDDQVEVQWDRGGLVIAISGDVDMESAPAIQVEMVDLIGADGVEEVALDLSDVGFFDSAGVRALVMAYRQAAALHLPLRVSDASPQCRRVLEVAGLEKLLGLG